ncbi:MAG TPA: nickel pincer cofactor biosynthesis protein LarC [Terriglobales bacterium]|nr:nickel pincer cofactor biosynthesis protein LarC [Terriglobales bacterium]
MRIAYLDCFSGISGDMFLGALVDAGVPAALLEKTVEALGVGARLEVSRVSRSGISATKVDVYSHGEKDLPREEFEKSRSQESGVGSQLAWARRPRDSRRDAGATGQDSGIGSQRDDHGGHPHHDDHEHQHADDRVGAELRSAQDGAGPRPHTSHADTNHTGHSHTGDLGPSRAGAPAPQGHSHGRGLKEIREVIRAAKGISETAKSTAIAAFENLGTAEAKIHHVPVESVHFHEVGAVDALVDICCAAVGAEALQIEEWICSPLNVGGGTVVCAHGTFPIPAPATLELLKDAPVYSSGPQKELVTPTGAAIAKTLATRFAAFPSMKVKATGYGAGTRDFSGYPNVLRLTVGESQAEAHAAAEEAIVVLEASIDDLNPQVFGYVMDRALAEGALDAFGTQLQMKKNRPGMLLTVLAKPSDAARLAKLIFAETSTLGVRIRQEQRRALGRRWVSVQTRWGEVRMKVASLNGSITNYAPEYEDCRKIAGEQHLPLKSVMQEAIRIYLAGAEPHQHG